MPNVTKQQRAAIKTKMKDYQAWRYRITKNDEIHFYGIMPNSTVVGWWFYDYLNPKVPWTEVNRETAYGSTTTISRSIRVF